MDITGTLTIDGVPVPFTGTAPDPAPTPTAAEVAAAMPPVPTAAEVAAAYLALSPPPSPIVPTPAAQAGLMVQTLGSRLELGRTWFDHNFYRLPVPGQSIQNGDGTMYLPNAGNGYGICTARQVNAKLGTWQGSAFKPPFYIEALISFAPAVAAIGVRTWPSFWANDIEGMSTVNAAAGSGDQWVGQAPGYLTAVELDFLEQQTSLAYYGMGMHHWYGPRGGGLQIHTAQPASNIAPWTFDKPFRVGFRILPATPTTPGEARWYLQGVQQGPAKTWLPYDATLLPPPQDGTSAFAVAETRHYSLIISTGDPSPMTVHAVSVWQRSTAGNLYQ